MHLEKINIKNLGPIDEFLIEPRFAENGHAVPIVLVGQNGAGKSLTLAVILDALTEARRASFNEIKEVRSTDYLRLSSKNYIKNRKGYSYAHITIHDEKTKIAFDEVVSNMPYEELEKTAEHIINLPNFYAEDFKKSGFYKSISIGDYHKEKIQKLNFLYFPFFRYEPASWMSERANVDFIKQDNYYGQSKINPIRTNIIEETKRWILNVLLDRELYEKQISPASFLGGPLNIFIDYKGPNTQLFGMINEILTVMYKAKNPEINSARVGIGPKRNREISIFIKKNEGKEEIIAPDISQLSSGELMVLGLATEIIRSYELVSDQVPNSLNDVTGVVLIDEIDLHLHISFQKTVLPLIVRKFPKVQFILTTHSPFFLLGMAESGDVDIYNLPIGNKISAGDFTEFKAGCDVFLSENEKFQARYESLYKKMQQDGRPLIITEGKTDWRHIQLALLALNLDGDIDVEFLEFNSEVNMGDTKLSQMCEYVATIPQRRKTIFVFDRDNPQITNKVSGYPNNFKEWGNQVFSLCLPIPSHRTSYKNLSIELYYKDDDLRTIDPSSGKRLWFTNEIEIITRPSSGQKTYRALESPILEEEFDKKVFDQPADQIVNVHGQPVGLSKSAFTEVVVGNPEISKKIDREAFELLFGVIREILEKK